MIPLVRHLVDQILHDELAVRRWGRTVLMTIGGSGIAFADQLAAVLGDGSPGTIKAIKVIAVVSAGLALMVTAGEKNPRPE